MGDSEQIYITKAGRVSKPIYPNLIKSNKKQISKKANMVFHDDVRREKELETALTSQGEVDRQKKEIDELRNQIRMRSENENQMRGLITNLQAELEKLRATTTSQSSPIVQQSAPTQPLTERDFTSEICTLLGNVQTTQLDMKIPEFKDENSSNPLEFLDEINKFCRFKNIKEDRKLNILNVALQGKSRIWFELQNNFNNYTEFRNAFVNEFYSIPLQVKSKNKWLSKRFVREQDKNLLTYYYAQLKEANYLRPIMSNFEKNFSIVQQFPEYIRKFLISLDYENTESIGQALVNLDAIENEKLRNVDRRFENSQQNIRVRQVNVNRRYTNNTYRDNGQYRQNRYDNTRGRFRNDSYVTDRDRRRHYYDPRERNIFRESETVVMPDTRLPPPNITNQPNIRNSTSNSISRNLNGQ